MTDIAVESRSQFEHSNNENSSTKFFVTPTKLISCHDRRDGGAESTSEETSQISQCSVDSSDESAEQSEADDATVLDNISSMTDHIKLRAISAPDMQVSRASTIKAHLKEIAPTPIEHVSLRSKIEFTETAQEKAARLDLERSEKAQNEAQQRQRESELLLKTLNESLKVKPIEHSAPNEITETDIHSERAIRIENERLTKAKKEAIDRHVNAVKLLNTITKNLKNSSANSPMHYRSVSSPEIDNSTVDDAVDSIAADSFAFQAAAVARFEAERLATFRAAELKAQEDLRARELELQERQAKARSEAQLSKEMKLKSEQQALASMTAEKERKAEERRRSLLSEMERRKRESMTADDLEREERERQREAERLVRVAKEKEERIKAEAERKRKAEIAAAAKKAAVEKLKAEAEAKILNLEMEAIIQNIITSVVETTIKKEEEEAKRAEAARIEVANAEAARVKAEKEKKMAYDAQIKKTEAAVCCSIM